MMMMMIMSQVPASGVGAPHQGQHGLPRPLHHRLHHDHSCPHGGLSDEHSHWHRHDPHRSSRVLSLYLLEKQTANRQENIRFVL